MLRADVRRAELARLLVGGEQGRLRVGRERRRNVRPLAFLRLLLELCGDRVRVGVDLLQDVAYDVVLKRGVEQVVGLEVEASPLERRLRSALKEPAGGVAEELRDVDGLGVPRRRLRRRSRRRARPAIRRRSRRRSRRRGCGRRRGDRIRSSARSISQRYSTSCVPSGRSRTRDATAGRRCRWQRCSTAISASLASSVIWAARGRPALSAPPLHFDLISIFCR